ncbi:MAG: RagB/SusD family nutrient uptake outer membrane protein [Bacteroidales bacterium]|nr:RagB/SusD family nutrient uptake outer membrane protein [Bacteroidales bacterium]
MKKTSLLLIGMTALMFIWSSCEKQLDISPVSEITSASYWNTADDVRGYLTGIYASYRSLTNTAVYSENRAELIVNGQQAPNLGNEHFHTLTSQSSHTNWKSNYTVIHHCNLLLKYAPDIDFIDNNEKDDILAQAYLMRALVYFRLIKIWKDVPLVLEPTEAPPSEYLPRTSVNDIMTQIKADIDQAIDLFSSDGINSRVRLSKPAAYATKADVYMWSGTVLGGGNSDIQTAVDAIDALDATGTCSLIPNYFDVFNTKENDEIIFATHWDKDESGSNFYSGYSIRIDGVPLSGLDSVPHAGDNGLNRVTFSQDLLNYYHQNPGDIREDINCSYAVNYDATPYDTTAWVCSKFIGQWFEGNRYFDNDIPIYRYADMILLKAEALNVLGQTAAAVTELNKTRNRAGIGDYTGATDQASLATEILIERARELCYENKHWEDLVRANKVPQYVPNYFANRGTDLRYIYWPIHDDLIAVNPELVQTDGY